MQENYDALLERISSSSGVSKDELEKKIEARRAKLSGLISKEGAAQIIAAEMNVNFDNVKLKLKEIMPGMKKVNVVGKIINIFPVRSFSKGNREGKVCNFIIADETGNTKVVLWDTNHIALIEEGRLKSNDVVEISAGSVREGEIHLSGLSNLKKSEEILNDVKTERTFDNVSLDKAFPGKGANIRALVVQVFPPRFFSVCPECGKKPVQEAEGFSCAQHGKIIPNERALINVVLDDGHDTLRAVIFSDQLEKLTNPLELKDNAKLEIFRKEILGTEFNVKGLIKKNALFNVNELTVQDIEKVDVEKLVEELEK